MSQALQNLLDLLDLEKIEEGLFRGQSEDLGLRQVFGGQVVGQALYAAKQTVPDERSVHSFHSYFLRPGDSSKPIVYDVETLRDGNSFSARRVSAIQHGKPIFYMTASFQSPEAGFEHQNLMPDVPPPEGLLSESEIAQKLAHMLPEKVREKFIGQKPIEMRPVKFHNPLKGSVEEPHRYVWFRANGSMPDDQRIHQYLLGYASDFNFLPTALQPHGVGFLSLACKWPPLTTPCGSTARSAWMTGCCTRWRAPPLPVHGALYAARSTPATASWSPPPCRKG